MLIPAPVSKRILSVARKTLALVVSTVPQHAWLRLAMCSWLWLTLYVPLMKRSILSRGLFASTSIIALSISLLLLTPWPKQLLADSLWQADQQSPYSTPVRKYKVGDVLTILIKETSAAAQEGHTAASKESEVKGSFMDMFQQVANAVAGSELTQRNREFKIGGGDKFQGDGETSRKSDIRATLTALVSEIQPNGNLTVYGQHRVKVNEEVETIQVRGDVRPQDITPQNTIYSYQIANGEVSLQGTGVVSSKQSPGVLTRLLGWLF